MPPKISIVISSYNYEEFVGASIESALAQDYPDIEVICVDDGSTDNSREVISRYPQVARIFKENAGETSAARAGLQAASGQIVIFLDSDDILYPQACSRVASAWSAGTTMVQFKLRRFSATNPDLGVIPAYPFSRALGQEVAKYGSFPSAPNSGNAFEINYSRMILTNIPDLAIMDSCLIFCAPMLGAVIQIDECLGGYRVHERNFSLASGSTIEKVRTKWLGQKALAELMRGITDSQKMQVRDKEHMLDASHWNFSSKLYICDAFPTGSAYRPRKIARYMLRRFLSEPRLSFVSRLENLIIAIGLLIAPGLTKRIVRPFVYARFGPDRSSDRVSWITRKVSIVHDGSARRALIETLGHPDRPTVLSFLNAHGFNLAWSSRPIRQAFQSSDILLRDGLGMKIFLAANGRSAGLNMNGTDLIPDILRRHSGKRVAIFGAIASNLQRAADVLSDRGVTVVSTLDGFQPTDVYVETARSISADVYVLAMGMPKQETVAIALREALEHPCLIISGGAIVDFISGAVPRAPKVMQRLGLEWLFRLALEPSRLFARYVVGNPLFLWRVLLARCSIKA